MGLMKKEEALKIVQEDCLELHNLPDHFKKDREIVLEAVKQDATILLDVDKSLLKDREIVLEAVKNTEKQSNS